MGFFDSFKKGYDSKYEQESKRSAQRSNYRNIVQEEASQYSALAAKDSGTLLREYNSIFTSESDKRVIAQILESRGYSKHGNGYSRR